MAFEHPNGQIGNEGLERTSPILGTLEILVSIVSQSETERDKIIEDNTDDEIPNLARKTKQNILISDSETNSDSNDTWEIDHDTGSDDELSTTRTGPRTWHFPRSRETALGARADQSGEVSTQSTTSGQTTIKLYIYRNSEVRSIMINTEDRHCYRQSSVQNNEKMTKCWKFSKFYYLKCKEFTIQDAQKKQISL